MNDYTLALEAGRAREWESQAPCVDMYHRPHLEHCEPARCAVNLYSFCAAKKPKAEVVDAGPEIRCKACRRRLPATQFCPRAQRTLTDDAYVCQQCQREKQKRAEVEARRQGRRRRMAGG